MERLDLGRACEKCEGRKEGLVYPVSIQPVDLGVSDGCPAAFGLLFCTRDLSGCMTGSVLQGKHTQGLLKHIHKIVYAIVTHLVCNF